MSSPFQREIQDSELRNWQNTGTKLGCLMNVILQRNINQSREEKSLQTDSRKLTRTEDSWNTGKGDGGKGVELVAMHRPAVPT